MHVLRTLSFFFYMKIGNLEIDEIIEFHHFNCQSTDIDMRLHAKQICVGRTGEYFRSLHTRLSSRLFQQKENNKKPNIAILYSKSM